MISKRPTAAPFARDRRSRSARFDRFQGAFDFGGPVDGTAASPIASPASPATAARQIDHYAATTSCFIAPSFTWRPTFDTTFTLLAHYSKIDNKGFQQYVPGVGSLICQSARADSATSRYLGEPAVDGYKLRAGRHRLRLRAPLQQRRCSSARTCATSTSRTISPARAPRACCRTSRTAPRSINYVNSGLQQPCDRQPASGRHRLPARCRTRSWSGSTTSTSRALRLSLRVHRRRSTSSIRAYGALGRRRASLAPFIASRYSSRSRPASTCRTRSRSTAGRWR